MSRHSPALAHRALAAALLAAALPLAAGAQQATPPAARVEAVPDIDATPRGLLMSYTGAIKRKDWAYAASFVHPEALAKVRQLVTIVTSNGMPPAMVAQLFAGLPADSLTSVSDVVLFARLVEGALQRQEGVAEVIGKMGVEPIGTVPEAGTGVSHMVYRVRLPMDERVTIEKVEVLGMRQLDGRWRVLLPGEVQMMVDMLSALAAGR